MSLKHLSKFIAETIDDSIYASRKIGEKIGYQPFIDSKLYAAQGAGYWVLFRNRYDFQVINPELVPKKDPCIIVCNHQSEMDPLVIGGAIYHANSRQAYFLGKAELIATPLFNVFTRMNKGIYVRRGESDEAALIKCKQVLYEGNLLVIYPEGTLNPGNGKFLEFKSGAIRLAHDCQVPIIPAAIFGIDRIFGKGAKVPQMKGKLRVKFGKPIPPEKLIKPKSNTDASLGIDALELTKATRKVQREVEKLWLDIWMQEQEKHKEHQEAQTSPTSAE
jgi:1-acyl-sn-glycerol-3-phosphate acyltransferase